MLPAAVAADRDRLSRFQREAQVLASLNHPNIALFYWTATQGSATLNVVTVTKSTAFVPSAPRMLFRFPAGTTWDVTPSPDRFLVEAISGKIPARSSRR